MLSITLLILLAFFIEFMLDFHNLKLEILNDSVFVLIPVKPDIRPIPDNGIIVAEEHDSVTLACEVTHGYPTPEVTW